RSHPARARAADPARRTWPRLSERRSRPDARADVYAAERLRRRRGHFTVCSERDIGSVRARHVWSPVSPAVPSELLSLHRAKRRSRHQLLAVRRRWLPDVQADRVARDPRVRHGASGRVRGRRIRRGKVHRLRMGNGDRARRDSSVPGGRYPVVLRERLEVSGTISVLTFSVLGSPFSVLNMRLLLSWLRDFVDVPASAEEIAAKLALRGFEV